jgi:hypothetical protein
MGNIVNKENSISSTRLISIDEFDFKKVQLYSTDKRVMEGTLYEYINIKYDGYSDWMIVINDVIMYENSFHNIEIISVNLVETFQYITNEFKKRTGIQIIPTYPAIFGFRYNYDYITCSVPNKYSTYLSYICKDGKSIMTNKFDNSVLQTSLFTNDKRFIVGINFNFLLQNHLLMNNPIVVMTNNIRYLTNINMSKSVCKILEKNNMFVKGVREIISDYLI